MDYAKFEARIKELGVKPNFLSKSVYVNLAEMISNDESVVAVSSCLGKMGQGGLVVTDKNFYSVVFNKAFGGADKVLMPLSKISSFTVSGLTGMKLTIIEGAVKYQYDGVSSSKAIVDALKEKDNNSFEQEKIEKPATSDPAEELRKYKQLLDDGIITQEDFDKKKAMLLGI